MMPNPMMGMAAGQPTMMVPNMTMNQDQEMGNDEGGDDRPESSEVSSSKLGSAS